MERADLGPVRFDARRGSPIVSVVFWAVGGASLLTGIAIAARGERDLLAAAVLACVTGILLAIAGLSGYRRRLWVHDRGLATQGIFSSPSVLRWDDIERIDWRAVRQRVHGVPTGTHVTGALFGAGRRASFHLRLSGSLGRQLEELRDLVTRHVEVRLAARLDAGEPVAWGTTDAVEIRREGLAWTRRKQRRTLPWSAPLEYRFARGGFFLHEGGAAKESLILDCDEPNFYPGFLLFLQHAPHAQQRP